MSKNTPVRVAGMIAVFMVIGALAGVGLFFGFAKWQKSTLASSQATVDPTKKAALDAAYQAGLLTQDEYNAKLRALSGTPASPASRPTDLAKSGWKTIIVKDPMFGMPAYQVKIPADWRFTGAVVRSACEEDQLVWRAESPDGLMGVQQMPKVHWVYSQNDEVLKESNRACGIHVPIPAATQAPEIARAARPQPEIGAVEPWTVPGKDAALAADNKAYEDQARGFGWDASKATHETGDAARVHIRYSYLGHAEEEWISVSTRITDEGVGVVGSGRSGILQSGWAHRIGTDTMVVGVRAPQGSIDAMTALAKEMGSQEIPEYARAVIALKARNFKEVEDLGRKVFQDTLQIGQINQQQLMANHDAYMKFTQQQYAQHNAQSQLDLQRKDANNKNFVDYVSNQTYYLDPETGRTATIKDVPGANGVAVPSVSGGWVLLQPISH